MFLWWVLGLKLFTVDFCDIYRNEISRWLIKKDRFLIYMISNFFNLFFSKKLILADIFLMNILMFFRLIYGNLN